MMKAAVFAGLVGLLPASSGQAQATACVGSSSIVFSDSVSFRLDAPRGWALDCEAGKHDGPLTVLYRIGESWQIGDAVMYANVLTLKAGDSVAFQPRVQAEVADWKTRVPDAVLMASPDLLTAQAQHATIRRFTSTTRRLYEVVAYIPRGRIIPILAMTARTSDAFDKALPDFERLVRSYTPGPSVRRP